MHTIRHLANVKTISVLAGFFCFVVPAFSGQIQFEHVVIDKDAIGHREVGDIDGDGFNDIAAVDTAKPEHLIVWYKYPDWKKYTITDISEFSDYKAYRSCDMELADIDGDGDLDLVGRIGKPKGQRDGVNCWFENPKPSGDPASDKWQRHDIGKSFYVKDLEVVDLNGDGKLDVISRAVNTKVHIYLQEDSSWKERVVNITHHDGMDTGDIDRDGDPDIVLNGYWLETPDDPSTGKWVKHDFDDKWYTQKTGEKGQWYDNNSKVVVVDMNGDGCLDIVINNAENKGFPVSWYQAPVDPKNGKWIEHVIGQVDKCHSLKIADFDNDGDLDVLAGEMPNFPEEAPHPVLVFINLGNALEWEQQLLANYGNYSADIGDIDNDGDIDIIGLRNHKTAPIEMWRNKTSDNKLSLDDWTYIEVDSNRGKWGDWDKPKWLRYFGLAMTDVTGNGYKDIIAGRYFYRNPGGDMSGRWQRVTFGINIDAMLAVDVDGDAFADAIAEALPNIYWIEAEDRQGTSWKVKKIGTLPKTGHVNGQGYMTGQIIPGGKPEIILSCGDGVYYLQIPENPEHGDWPKTRIAAETDEGIGVADIDGDGDIDIATGKKEGKTFMVMWYENPGNGSADWKGHLVSKTAFAPDRVVIAEINGDSRLDIVVSEERYPGPDPDASLYWFEQPGNPKSQTWKKHVIITEYSLNNLDVADMDRDGDFDVITCEHKGPKGKFKLQIFENDGKGNFTEHIADRGKESHLGARVADMDNDGDLDIVSVAWDDYQYLHLWRNDTCKKAGEPEKIKWRHLSSQDGDLPPADVGNQAASLVFDIDGDGANDFVIAGWGDTRMVWFRRTPDGWKRYLVDNQGSHIEAGGAYYDIDADGDLDILQGGSWATNEVWWWENPCPDYEHGTAWNRYTIKDWGRKQHHDQIFGDFDNDGRAELVFWNQTAKKLLIADIPNNPKDKDAWSFSEIWSWPRKYKYEGLAKGDIDLDGKIDLVGGGFWFKHLSGKVFTANKIDDYGTSRSAVGDLIKGGRPEVVLGSGDSVGPLNLYQWKQNTWVKHTLIETVVHGHSLQVGDINGDGNLDIYTAEMYRPGAGANCKQWVLYGDGRGNFTIQLISTGIGAHEARIADLDGDGDLDILQKDFQQDQRVDIWLNNGTDKN